MTNVFLDNRSTSNQRELFKLKTFHWSEKTTPKKEENIFKSDRYRFLFKKMYKELNSNKSLREPNGKWTKKFDRHFPKEDAKIVNKHMERFWILSVNEEPTSGLGTWCRFRLPYRMPASHHEGSSTRPDSSTSNAGFCPEGIRWWLKCLGSRTGRPWLSSDLLTSMWPSPSGCQHKRGELVSDYFYFSLPFKLKKKNRK